MSTDFCDIRKLAELFEINQKNNNNSSDSDDEEELNELDDNNEKQKEQKVNPYNKIETEPRNDVTEKNFDECDYEEYLAKDENNTETNNWKKVPEWNISYRQQVTASDVFLQMGAKTPQTASCEDMIVTILLPGEHMQNIDLKILNTSLELTSPNFSLNLPLPHPVDPKLGNANWVKDEEKLMVTLRMDRELDFVNF